MRIVELTKNKLLLPLSNEEHELLEQFGDDPIAKNTLNER